MVFSNVLYTKSQICDAFSNTRKKDSMSLFSSVLLTVVPIFKFSTKYYTQNHNTPNTALIELYYIGNIF